MFFVWQQDRWVAGLGCRIILISLALEARDRRERRRGQHQGSDLFLEMFWNVLTSLFLRTGRRNIGHTWDQPSNVVIGKAREGEVGYSKRGYPFRTPVKKKGDGGRPCHERADALGGLCQVEADIEVPWMPSYGQDEAGKPTRAFLPVFCSPFLLLHYYQNPIRWKTYPSKRQKERSVLAESAAASRVLSPLSRPRACRRRTRQRRP